MLPAGAPARHRASGGTGTAAMRRASNPISQENIKENINEKIKESISRGSIKQESPASVPLPSCIVMLRRGATLLPAHRVGPTSRRGHDVTKEELLEFEGLVTEILPDARYRIQLDNGHILVAYTAGRMKKNRIKTLAGDRVTVEVSPYDLEKGRLIFRHKDERAGSMNRPPQRNQFRRR